MAGLLSLPRAAAGWVKREPCVRIEGPHLLVGEDASRRFTEPPVAADAIGALAVPGPAGLLPFDRLHAPSEWRALRLRLKRLALGDNVFRLLTGLGRAARDVPLAGGAAGDAEILRVLDRCAPGALLGRAAVAADTGHGLSHRWAVGYGLMLLGR